MGKVPGEESGIESGEQWTRGMPFQACLLSLKRLGINAADYPSTCTGFALVCSGSIGTNGNVSADPMFTAGYKVRGGSPAIDAGSNTAPNLPNTDLSGNPRIVNGNGGPNASVDMGAYEFLPVTLTPKTLNFGSQSVGSTTIKITLTNAQNKSLNISSKTVPTGYKVSGCGTSVAAFSSCSLTVTFHPLTLSDHLKSGQRLSVKTGQREAAGTFIFYRVIPCR